jgi:rubrerythrin
MKKNILFLALFAATGLFTLPSCGPQTDANAELVAPETTQQDAAAKSSAKEEEDDDDDKGKNKQTNLKGAEANTATVQNLITAYTGESTATAKYAAYAKKAQEEGYTQIALLFKATSASEKIHANNHRSVLEDMGEKVPNVTPQFTVKTTKENLADAIAGESYEIATMYPDFLAVANAADNQLALTSLNYAYRTEQRHKPMYEKALAALQNNQLGTMAAAYYICPTCGNTYDTTTPKRCRISMTDSEKMVKINSL